MKRPGKTRLAGLVIVGLVLSFACGTACAMQRRAMGPMQCCKSHCQHESMPARDAERCCQSHLTALPTATGTALKSLPGPGAGVGSSTPAILPLLAADPGAALPVRVAPPPRGPTLFALRTSLLR